MTVLRSGSASDVGRVRTVNEDLALESLTLFAVADGMGGHVGGEIAAAHRHRHPAGRVRPQALGRRPGGRDPRGQPGRLGARPRRCRTCGAWAPRMIAAALVATDDGDRLVLANVGDSRAYRLHGGELVQLTTDHSVAEELVARGELSEAEAAVHPHRHILTRALGCRARRGRRRVAGRPRRGRPVPAVLRRADQRGARRTDHRGPVRTRDPQEAAETLVRLANEAGGNDNITVVVLDVMVGETALGRSRRRAGR